MNAYTAIPWSPKVISQANMLQAPSLSVGPLPGDVTTQILLPRRILIARIQQVVADFFRIPEAEMKSARRARYVARPRQIAMYLARELTPKSLPDIGRYFGDRDHTTVIHAIKQVERLRKEDPDFRVDVEVLRERLEA